MSQSPVSRFQMALAVLAGLLCLSAILMPFGSNDGTPIQSWDHPPVLLFLILTPIGLFWFREALWPGFTAIAAIIGAAILVNALSQVETGLLGFWFMLLALWVLTWLFAERLSNALAHWPGASVIFTILVPLMFGAAILVVWETVTRGANVPNILLPPPSRVWLTLSANIPKLIADFQQTFLKAVLAGYVLGCGSAFLVAIAIDRSPFLKSGLLPLGNFISALPLVGIAPIMVMWFGFDWPSKAAVVVIMTFFPMLVNTVAGLNDAGQIERDMMRTYAAPYWPTLFKLRLPTAAPFIFNALKINATLAVIGAIVAEFFGTPIVGMGFRISTEIGKLNVAMVWAEIAVAALAGSAFYWVVALFERAVTFWHPSVRGGRAQQGKGRLQ